MTLQDAHDDDHQRRLTHCWLQQSCTLCLTSPHDCGWCGAVRETNPILLFWSHGTRKLWRSQTILSKATETGNIASRSFSNSRHHARLLQSQTCLPLPRSHIPPLLHPLFHPRQPVSICPVYEDRWDLRTRTFGCYVSTFTVVAIVATVLCTIAGLIVLWGLWRGARWVGKPWRGGSGIELRVGEGERVWKTQSDGFWARYWTRRMTDRGWQRVGDVDE